MTRSKPPYHKNNLFGVFSVTLALLSYPPVAAAQPGQEVPKAEEPSGPAVTAISPEIPWAGTVELYGFAPLKTAGSTTFKGFSSDFDVSLGSALQSLSAAGSIRGSLEYKRIGLLTDISYTSVQSEKGLTRASLDANKNLGYFGRRSVGYSLGERTLTTSIGNIEGIYDVALRYRFGEREAAVARPGSFSVIPYAGVRFVNMQYFLGLEAQGSGSNITYTGPRRTISLDGPPHSFNRYGEFGSTAVQPLIGSQAMLFLSPRLRIFARADVAGLGVNNGASNSWNTQLGLGYAVGNSTQLNISWRYLHLSNSNGATPENAYSVNQNGIEAGIKFFF